MAETISPYAGKPIDAVPAGRCAAPGHRLLHRQAGPGHPGAAGRVRHLGASRIGVRPSFNEAHILATTQAICLHRARQGVTGPLFIGIDPHALSTPALATALEVLAANGVETMIDEHGG